MESPQDRVNLLKWATKSFSSIKSMLKKYERIMEEAEDHHRLSDLSLRAGYSELLSLMDRVEYLDKEADAQKYINDGVLQTRKG